MKRVYLLVIVVLLGPERIHSSYRWLLYELKSELNFEYVVLLGKAEPFWQELLWQLPVPIIKMDKETETKSSLGIHHSHQLLTIAFLEESVDECMELLYSTLQMLNTQPVLLVIKYPNIRIYSILEWCWQHKLLNVLVIDTDFQDSMIVYGYTPFPIFQFIERRLQNNTIIFEQRLWNLNGYKLPVVVGGSSPRLIVYRGMNRELIYSGMVGNLMKCFEQRFNCKLVQPYPFDESAIPPAQELLGFVRNGSAQFALAAIYPKFPFNGYSYPIELMSWCLMMPVPAEVPHSHLYTMVFHPSAFWLIIGGLILISLTLSLALRLHGYRVNVSELFLHTSCLRGILSQPFYEVLRAPTLVRGIYLLICILGILITAWYNSYFSTFVTSPPLLPPFTSYESIKNSHVKVVVWTPEYQVLIRMAESLEKYSSIFQFQASYKEFLLLRDSFDTRYGYMMPLEKWSLVKEQQKVFSSPLFTLREDLCFYHTVPIVFPIAENSVFREPLQQLILDVTATGLLDRWHDMAFTDMIKAGQLSLVDRGKPKEFRAMKLQDLDQILIAGGLLLGLATLVFLLEVVWFWRKKISSSVLSRFNVRA
ncbi:hypothetical protein KR074_006997 [Drosophila pseudoananassae]|nr:hypothetical protein KR074_006997 [Drosophila pseudoananassae]